MAFSWVAHFAASGVRRKKHYAPSVSGSVNIYGAIQQSVAQYSRASGVPVPGGSATGFVLFNSALQRNYLVTNRHVIDPAFRGDVGAALSEIGIRGHYQSLISTALPNRLTAESQNRLSSSMMIHQSTWQLFRVRSSGAREIRGAAVSGV